MTFPGTTTKPFPSSSQSPTRATYIALPDLENGPLDRQQHGHHGLLDIPLDAEKNDDEDDRDEEQQTERCIDLCTPWALLNVGGLLLMTGIVVGVFVGVPIVVFATRAVGG